MSEYKLSVVLATYNGEKYIKEQLESILVQIGPQDEVIVSDDHSTDGTINVIRALNDVRIKIVLNGLGQGYTRNFENALQKAKGDIIFLSDQDDVWEKDKVSVMVEKLKDNDLVVSDALISDANLKPTLGSHFKLFKTKRGFLNNWLKTRYIGACMAFNRRILNKVLPFPSNQKLCAHDYWIANVGEFYFRVGLVDETLLKYRRHGDNASTGGMMAGNSLIHKLKVRFYVLLQLLKRI